MFLKKGWPSYLQYPILRLLRDADSLVGSTINRLGSERAHNITWHVRFLHIKEYAKGFQRKEKRDEAVEGSLYSSFFFFT